MRAKFQEQMNEMPAVAQNLKKLEEIPGKLEEVANSITQSQNRLASDFVSASQRIVKTANKSSVSQPNDVMQDVPEVSTVQIPSSIKWTVIVGIILITLATIGNTAYNIWKGETASVRVYQPTLPVPTGTVISNDPADLQNQ